jgi:hypothetical protein
LKITITQVSGFPGAEQSYPGIWKHPFGALMHNKSLAFQLCILLILLNSSACSSQKTQQSALPIDETTVAQLGDPQIVEGTKISYRPIPGYQLESTTAIVTMSDPAAEGMAGPAVTIMIGPPRLPSRDQYARSLLSGSPSRKILSAEDIEIAGSKGYMIEMADTINGITLLYRAAGLQKGLLSSVVVMGWATDDKMPQLIPLYNAVLASIR